MTPRHPVKRAALLANACLSSFTVRAQSDRRCGTALHVFGAVAAPLMLAWAGAGASGAWAADASAPIGAAAPQARAHERDTTELQRQFWRCDHAATRAPLNFETAAHCSRITEEFRRLRFGDDFDAFLAWWRAHKAAEHAALDTGTAAAARPAAGPAASPTGLLDGATPEQLQTAYLHCDRLARTEHFDSAAAAACSIVFEAMKARVFGGSTERFIAWMKQQQAALADRARPDGRR